MLNSWKEIMGGLDDYMPAIAMFGLQFTSAGVALSTRAVLLQGLSPRVFVVYRQATATLVIAPLAYFTRKSSAPCLGLRSFSLIFLTALLGVTIMQNIYFEGLYLASSSIASAMNNLVPAITFVIAFIVRLEKLNVGSLRSIAKIVGTVLCVGGAVSMALFKGPKLLNSELIPSKSLLGLGGEDDRLLGCLCLFASSCCWSIWLILQVPVSASYPDHLSLSAWMCLLATLQSATLTFFLEPDPEAWKLHSYFQLGACFYSGIIGSAVSFFVQAWCISRRGPLFSAMFNPLCTVIVTIFASIFLHEEIYTGSLIGSLGVIGGLYVVLWGKAKDLEDQSNDEKKMTDPKLQIDETKIQILVDESSGRMVCKNIDGDLEKPLLSDKSTKVDDCQTN